MPNTISYIFRDELRVSAANKGSKFDINSSSPSHKVIVTRPDGTQTIATFETDIGHTSAENGAMWPTAVQVADAYLCLGYGRETGEDLLIVVESVGEKSYPDFTARTLRYEHSTDTYYCIEYPRIY